MKQQCITLKQSIQLVSVSKWFRHVSVSGPTKKPTTSRHDNAADNKSRAVLCNININLMEKLHEKCVFLTSCDNVNKNLPEQNRSEIHRFKCRTCMGRSFVSTCVFKRSWQCVGWCAQLPGYTKRYFLYQFSEKFPYGATTFLFEIK